MEEPFPLGQGVFEALVEDLLAAAAEGELDALGRGGILGGGGEAGQGRV